MSVLPIIVFVEDDDAIQLVVEEALEEGGFEISVVATGEEAAVSHLQGGLITYRTLVIDVNLLGRFDAWQVASLPRNASSARHD